MRNFGEDMDSQTGLVMRIVPSSRPLALASPSREAALLSATLSRFQVDQILFLITKRVRESKSFVSVWLKPQRSHCSVVAFAKN